MSYTLFLNILNRPPPQKSLECVFSINRGILYAQSPEWWVKELPKLAALPIPWG